MARPWAVILAAWLMMPGIAAAAEELFDTAQGQRIDSQYCTIWLESGMTAKQLNRQVSTWLVRPQRAMAKANGETPEEQLAAKCDMIFQRAKELLDMHPPGIHVTIRVAREQDQIKAVHAARYGFGTEAIAFYMFEDNTIYATAGEVSSSVLAHEMAHSIIDHYFGMRPPRKIEEMLAMYVDEHLTD